MFARPGSDSALTSLPHPAMAVAAPQPPAPFGEIDFGMLSSLLDVVNQSLCVAAPYDDQPYDPEYPGYNGEHISALFHRRRSRSPPRPQPYYLPEPPRKRPRTFATTEQPTESLLICNLPFDITEDQLLRYFYDGSVVGANVSSKDRKTWATVDFANVQGAKWAFDTLQHAQIGGRSVYAHFCRYNR